MALRSLLRRIPCHVRLSQSGPLMGPVQGSSPAAASRFLGTQVRPTLIIHPGKSFIRDAISYMLASALPIVIIGAMSLNS